ncbi:MAG: PaaX family transcriptional regulator C-terminal domain-containing protein [Patescibacteria group bacterium]
MRKKGIKRILSRAALALAEGLFSHAVDLALWTIVYMGELGIPQSTTGQIGRAKIGADQFLDQINYDVIKNAFKTAQRRGWIKTRRRNARPEITEEGKRRLASVIPQYDEKRLWDGKMHLVTYDIPESRKIDRELLRAYLRRIGCAMLQESVWITPYNPIDLVRSFVDEKELSGTVIVSDMGKDGAVGEEDLRSLLVRIYNLERLNERYEEWFSSIGELDYIDHFTLIRYLAILADDPQLPFSLLPPWWRGDKANALVKSQLLSVSKSLRPQVN